MNRAEAVKSTENGDYRTVIYTSYNLDELTSSAKKDVPLKSRAFGVVTLERYVLVVTSLQTNRTARIPYRQILDIV